MPYTSEHKQKTHARIIESARRLFNRRGFSEVSIDEVMASANLTRGGFYNHFKAKEDLYAEVLTTFAKCREGDVANPPHKGPAFARFIVSRYVSRQHLEDMDDQCPLVALPSDVSRAGSVVRGAYQRVLEALIGVFEKNVVSHDRLSARQFGLAAASTCVGAMVLARTVDDADLADEIREAARAFVFEAIGELPED